MPRIGRWAVPLVFAALLAVFAFGVWSSYRESFPGAGLYRVSGTVQGRVGDMLLVKHDAVPGLMQEMGSMALVAESRELLDRAGLAPGDHVRLTVRQVRDTPADKLVVVEIKKLP